HFYLGDVAEVSNSLGYGTAEPVTLADVQHNLGLISEPFARDVARNVLTEGRLRVSPYHGQVFTDDLAPVERLIDEIIFGYVTGRCGRPSPAPRPATDLTPGRAAALARSRRCGRFRRSAELARPGFAGLVVSAPRPHG